MALKGINHVVLKVRDLDTSEDFYRLLGFELSGHREGMRFYTCGTHHHDLALFKVDGAAPLPPREGTGMYHFSVTVEREEELSELHKKIVDAGYKVISVWDHVVSRSFYCLDPDKNAVEITWDVPESEWRHLENPLAVDRPYELPPLPSDE